MDQLRIRFGLYVQVWEPSTQTNRMKPRSQGAIAFGPSPTSTTGYVFMALDTEKIIIRSQFKDIPMTESVISRVNQLGSLEPAMLTWTNRHGEDIGNGPLWDVMPTSRNASNPSTVEESTEEYDEDVSVILFRCLHNSAGNTSILASWRCIPQWPIADIFSTTICPRQHRRLRRT